MCSDAPALKEHRSVWPPVSSNPKTWIEWARPAGKSFWLRPRQYDPILRDRLILVRANELLRPAQRANIDRADVLDACAFVAESHRVVWHNPTKGGASQPHSAHFQSAPLYWPDAAGCHYTFPCCHYQNNQPLWQAPKDIKVQLIKRGLEATRYPVLGLTVAGPLGSVAPFVWSVVWDYDRAAACNLIIQPDDQPGRADNVRVFVFPRARKRPNSSVTQQLLTAAEQILMRNNHDGQHGPWSFAGVEMGLPDPDRVGAGLRHNAGQARAVGKHVVTAFTATDPR